MPFLPYFNFNKKFLLVSIFPFLFSISSRAMDDTINYQLFDAEESKGCCRKKAPDAVLEFEKTNEPKCQLILSLLDRCKKSPSEGLEIFEEPAEPKCVLVRSLLGRCWNKLNPHHELIEQDENTPRCLKIKTETWKRLPLMTAEIATKLGIVGFMYTQYGQNELTFFAQHHASESLGRLFKFKKWQLPLTLITGTILYWVGLGILDMEEYFGYASGIPMVMGLLVYQVVKQYFLKVNPEEGERALMQALHDIKLLKERMQDLEAQAHHDA